MLSFFKGKPSSKAALKNIFHFLKALIIQVLWKTLPTKHGAMQFHFLLAKMHSRTSRRKKKLSDTQVPNLTET